MKMKIAWPYGIFVVIALALFPTSGNALGSAKQRAACTSDVFRLCFSDIPNVSNIVACLKKKHNELSAGCRAVFDHNARTQTAARTRSLGLPKNHWCDFGTSAANPQQKVWEKWCGSGNR